MGGTEIRLVFSAAWLLLTMTIIANVQGEQCDINEAQPTVWLGDEDDDFYCQGDVTHCAHFGLDFVCDNPNGGALEPCVNGTKVKCAAPPAIALADPTPATSIKVLTYNVFELRYLYWQSGQRERTCRTLHKVFSMLPDLDVIIFNEVFMGGCFAPFNTTIDASLLTIRDILDQHGFYYYTDTVGVGYLVDLQIENGGAFIASRWPMVKKSSHVFQEIEVYEFMAKGVVYAMVNKTVAGESMMYHVFGTHMQAFRFADEDNVRVAQAGEIHTFMLEQDISEDEPVIYGGDMNARLNTPNGDNVVQALDATLPQNVGTLNVTYDPVNNDNFDESNDSSWWIDYVLYSNSHIQPRYSSVQVVRPLIEPIQVCFTALSATPSYPNSDSCSEIRNISDLSDHYAVLGAFEYPTLTTTTLSTTTGSRAAYHVFSGWLVGTVMMIALICGS